MAIFPDRSTPLPFFVSRFATSAECVEEFGAEFFQVLQAGGLSEAEAQGAAEEAAAQLANFVLGFWSWG